MPSGETHRAWALYVARGQPDEMRSASFNPVILGLAFVLSAGCRDDGGNQLTGKPLLPPGTKIVF